MKNKDIFPLSNKKWWRLHIVYIINNNKVILLEYIKNLLKLCCHTILIYYVSITNLKIKSRIFVSI